MGNLAKTNQDIYKEMSAHFVVPHCLAPKFDLIAAGIHPEEKRILTDSERLSLEYVLSVLKYGTVADLMFDNPINFRKNALLWLKYFPELSHLSSFEIDSVYDIICDFLLDQIDIVDITYAFYPINLNNHRFIRTSMDSIRRKLIDEFRFDPKLRGNIVYNILFSAESPIGEIAEKKSGLTSKIKKGFGLNAYPSGLLFKFLLDTNITINDLLNPRQFEDLVATIYRAEGWDITQMPKTRDGGKDIIAKGSLDGRNVVVYIQAKRYSQSNPVSINYVKEFVATVAADKVDKGFMVTTSYFTEPSTTWLYTKGVSVANVELIDKIQLVRKMEKLTDSEISAYLLE